MLNPIIMSRTVRVSPLLVLMAILVGASLGSWVGGIFGALVAGAAGHTHRGRDPGADPRDLDGDRHAPADRGHRPRRGQAWSSGLNSGMLTSA